MKPRRAKWWTPSYGFIAGAHASECPVSAITQKSYELVHIVRTLEIAHASTGSSLSIDSMPGYLLDAMQRCEQESKAAERAEREAAETH